MAKRGIRTGKKTKDLCECPEGRPIIVSRTDCEGVKWFIPAFKDKQGKVTLTYGRFSTRKKAVEELREGFGYKNFERVI
jgi:hypothetical protein